MTISSLDELKAYYPDRVIMQYRGKTRWGNLIKALVQEVWADGIIQDETTCFDLDTAEGAQLDVLGRIVGVNRNIYGLDLAHDFFEMTDYADSISGVEMQIYSDTTDGPEIMLRYRATESYAMSENEMRTIVKLKIIFNTNNMTTKSIVDSLFDLFDDDVEFVDNQDMTVEFNVAANYENIFLIADYLKIVPKPAGVSYSINYV